MLRLALVQNRCTAPQRLCRQLGRLTLPIITQMLVLIMMVVIRLILLVLDLDVDRVTLVVAARRSAALVAERNLKSVLAEDFGQAWSTGSIPRRE